MSLVFQKAFDWPTFQNLRGRDVGTSDTFTIVLVRNHKVVRGAAAKAKKRKAAVCRMLQAHKVLRNCYPA